MHKNYMVKQGFNLDCSITQQRYFLLLEFRQFLKFKANTLIHESIDYIDTYAKLAVLNDLIDEFEISHNTEIDIIINKHTS